MDASDMCDVVYLEHHRSFREAAARAIAIAAKQHVTTTVSCDWQQWRVGVAAGDGGSQAVTDFAADNSHSKEMDDAFEAQDSFDEVHREIMEEIEAERDDWARSNEDGWFYGDDDGN
jgi:hypothetical protein